MTDRTKTSSDETSHAGGEAGADAATQDTAAVEFGADAAPTRAPFAPGDTIDRFTVLAELGAGGMGRVVAAYDPGLDRRVAIKVLYARSRSRTWRQQAQIRLLREAQAMARLSHPNVVTVYEVGHLDDDLFIAMAYVQGSTLRQWLTAEPRAWPDVLDVFVQAGHGLAAAHAAGLVHRDFKPDNVLVGDDGSVRVTDFGLVGAAPSEEPEPQAPWKADDELTVTGTIFGTPRYMAPEQHRGDTTDARTDQFAFGVALYEALYGQRPFAGDHIAELSRAAHAGEVRPPPSSDVPPVVQRAVLRALSPAAADRHASMGELLAILTRDPAATRRRVLIGVGAVAVVAAAIAATAMLSSRRPSYCAAAAGDAARVWSPARAAELTAAFATTGRPHAAASAAFVTGAIDRRVADWTAMRTQACEATRVRGEQSEALLDRRMACLDRQLGEVGALVRVLTDAPTPKVVDRAISATLALRALNECADAEALMAEVPLPRDPAARAAIARAQAQLAEAVADHDTARYPEAKALFTTVIEQGRTLDHAPLLAEALFRKARTDHELGDGESAVTALQEAALQGARAHDDALVADVWIQLLFTMGDQQGKHLEALALRPVIEAALARAGDPPMVRANYLSDSGVILMLAGKLKEAKAAHEEALRIRTEVQGPDGAMVGRSHEGLGNTLVRLGEYALARPHLERAVAIKERLVGTDHPEVGGRLNNLATALIQLNDRDGARALWKRNLELVERVSGPGAPGTTAPLINTAMSYYGEGRYDEAIPIFERGLEVVIKHNGPQHPHVGLISTALGSIAVAQGRFDDARAHYARSLAVDDASLGPDDYNRAYTLAGLASLELETNQLDVAKAHIDRALALRTAELGDQHEDVAESIAQRGDWARAARGCAAALPDYRQALAITEGATGADSLETANMASRLGECLLDLGKAGEALPLLERAAAIAAKAGGHAQGHADTDYFLARALVTTGGDRARAITLAESARAAYVAGRRPDKARMVEAWLRANPR